MSTDAPPPFEMVGSVPLPTSRIHLLSLLQVETKESATDQVQNDNNVHLLVIGINSYPFLQETEDLKAAVADADAMQDVLTNLLKVSTTNIISLRDGEATRQGILSAFSRLEENTAATVNPCIIIYYAGHGASGPRPDGWEGWTTDRDIIEQLCPSDLGAVVDGQVVEGIPDRVICALLNSLAKKRGNNIVSPNSLYSAAETRQD
jgi:hypothetical protein